MCVCWLMPDVPAGRDTKNVRQVCVQQRRQRAHLERAAKHSAPCPLCAWAPPLPAWQFQGACFKDDRTLLVTEYMEVSCSGVS